MRPSRTDSRSTAVLRATVVATSSSNVHEMIDRADVVANPAQARLAAADLACKPTSSGAGRRPDLSGRSWCGSCLRRAIAFARWFGDGIAARQFQSDRLEIVRGDIRNRSDLDAAMSGIEYVYHLAHAQCKTWDEYRANDIEPTRLVGEACLAAKVKRLIYTGTIDSYYAGAKAGTITEAPRSIRISCAETITPAQRPQPRIS